MPALSKARRATPTKANAHSMTSDGLPTPPIGVAMVIRAAGQEETSLAQLATLVEREPGLTIALLRLANSATYGVGREVRSVGQAAIYLGARVVRNIAVAHAVRLMGAKLDTGDFDGIGFWEDSLRRACAAQVLAIAAGYEDPSEAFTVGLIQDIGTLMMAVSNPAHSGALNAVRRSPVAERLACEQKHFGQSHATFFSSVAHSWGIPSDIVAAIAHHHSDDIPDGNRRLHRLASIARAADALADVTQSGGHAEAVHRAEAIVAELPSREPLELQALVDAIAEAMKEASADLQITIAEQPTFEGLIQEANGRLVEISADYEELTQKLERLLAEKQALARELETANAALRHLAATDALTQVGNRGYFTKALEHMLDEHAAEGTPVSVIMLDLDRFKLVNDTLGHAAGDAVLKQIAARLREAVRTEDIVGRLGGEEFAVALPICNAEDGAMVAERLRQAIANLPVVLRTGQPLDVSASFGGMTVYGGVAGDDVLQAADKAMYESKTGGRNRVTWHVPPTTTPQPTPILGRAPNIGAEKRQLWRTV